MLCRVLLVFCVYSWLCVLFGCVVFSSFFVVVFAIGVHGSLSLAIVVLLAWCDILTCCCLFVVRSS